MIIQGLLELIIFMIEFIFNLIPNIPPMPSSISNTLSHVTDIITSNLGLMEVAIRPSTIQIILPLLIVILNLEHIWNFTWWIMKKIPFLNIS